MKKTNLFFFALFIAANVFVCMMMSLFQIRASKREVKKLK